MTNTVLLKALVISVGIGTKRNTNVIKSLAGAIAHSINHHNPDKVFLVTSRQGVVNTLPIILDKTKLSKQKYEIIELSDPDNIQDVYETVVPHFKRIKARFDNIVVDYTSGTKAMTAALAILATLHEVQELSYITEKSWWNSSSRYGENNGHPAILYNNRTENQTGHQIL